LSGCAARRIEYVGTSTIVAMSRAHPPHDENGNATMTLHADLLADLEVHRQRLGKTARGPFLIELVGRSLNPYFCPVLLYRLAYRTRSTLFGLPGIAFSRLNYFLFGLEIARHTPIGPGLFFPHTRGTVIGAASIGRNVVVYHGVTLGARQIDVGFNADTRPTIGDDVVIGAGASVLGAVSVGDGARIGSNVVVTRDLPPGIIATAPEPVLRHRSAPA
jgi:serine O-acetyltransferase